MLQALRPTTLLNNIPTQVFNLKNICERLLLYVILQQDAEPEKYATKNV